MADCTFTESFIQDLLWRHLPPREWVVPNVHHFEWESDLLTVLKSGRTEEYEIKCSRADFLADRKKTLKMEILRTGSYTKMTYDWKTQQKAPAGRVPARRPNRFFYVTAPGIVTLDDIPHFAGWIECRPGGYVTKKRAPLLHDQAMKESHYRSLGRSMMFRYWQFRQRTEQ